MGYNLQAWRKILLDQEHLYHCGVCHWQEMAGSSMLKNQDMKVSLMLRYDSLATR